MYLRVSEKSSKMKTITKKSCTSMKMTEVILWESRPGSRDKNDGGMKKQDEKIFL